MNLIRLCCLTAFVGLLPAQTVTFPSDHANVPDGALSQDWFPYSYGIGRFQAVYEAWDLQIPAGRQITRIGFRAEPGAIATGYALQLQVRMGPTDRTSADLGYDYDANWQSPPTTVFGTAIFTLPELGNPANPNPGGPNVWLTLTTPYTWNPAHNLLVEWRVFANSHGGASFSYPLDFPTFQSATSSGPQGCLHSGGQRPVLDNLPAEVGGYWYANLTSAPASQFAVLVVAPNSNLVAPYPLTPFVPAIGASCTGQVPLGSILTLSAFTDGGGNATWITAIPPDRVFNDMNLAAQAVCFDFFAPGEVVVSNGAQLQLGIAPATSVLWSQGSATATSGSVYYHWGPVTVFAHN